MILIFLSLFVLLFTAFSYSKIIAEIIFLKTQLSIVKSQNKIKSYKTDIFQKLSLSFLFTFLHQPKHLCYIFTPETILKWYKDITKKFWTFKNKNKKGRPAIPPDTKNLIIQMKKDNPKWGYAYPHYICRMYGSNFIFIRYFSLTSSILLLSIVNVYFSAVSIVI